MRRFVEECQKEWNRLGVSQATANEMAVDLELDLEEAEADGVSPEEVLGNGYFDARAFAAEWARARGVVNAPTTRRVLVAQVRVRPLILTVSALGCVALVALGLLMLFGAHTGSMSIAVASFRHVLARPVPAAFFRPGRFDSSGPGAPLAALGLILLVSGLVGAGVTFWYWRARSTVADQLELERSIGMPSYF